MVQRTWWHLDGRRRMPNDYEIASSRLHWWPQLGFSIATPVAAWHERHVTRSPLRCSDWEKFHDPAELTYARYVALSRDREAFFEGLLDSSDGCAPDPRFARVLAPLRFPLHALQMVAAYLGSLAPSGKITIAAAFQAADELRRVHHVAQRLSQLEPIVPGVARNGRDAWEQDPSWQPLRELIERLLIAFDFSDCFAALQLVVKPCFDELFIVQLARLARAAGDDLLARLLASHLEASRWQRDWTAALVRMLIDDDAANRERLLEAMEPWRSRARAAIAALEPALSSQAGADVAAALRAATAAPDEIARSLARTTTETTRSAP